RSISVEVNASLIEYRGEPADMAIVRDITERKQMEKELRRLSAAVEQSTEGYVITDMEGTVIYANSAVERLYGYPPDELAGKPVFSLNAASADSGAVQREFMDSGFWSGEVEQRRKDGSTFPALLSLFTVKNEGGKVSSAVASVRDITERKRAQRELEEKEAYLENIINTVADPLFVKDRDHNWILLNDAYCSFMGYSRDELLGRSDYDFFPDEEADVFWEKDEEVFETGQENVNEEKFTDKQGTTHTVITRKKAYTNEKGEQTLVGTIHDISQRKQMEQELEQLSEEQQILLDSTPAMIFWIDSHGRFVRVNERLAATMDMTADELAGTSLHDLYPAAQAEKYERDNCEVMESGKPKRNIEEPVDTPEGTRWVSTTKVPYRDADGNVVGVIGFSVDITEQKRAEQQIREQKKLARTLLDATHDVALLADVDGTILAVNEAMAEAMDDDREAIVGSHMRDRIGAEAYARRTPKVREVQRTKQPVQFTDEREGRTFSHRYYPVFDERGEVRQVAVFSRDITDRKRAEQQLRENEERYRRLVEASPDSIILVGLDGRILTANERAAAVHRFASPEAMVGRDSFAYVAPEDRQRARENMHRVLEEGLVENLEYTFLREDGTSFLAEISVAAIYDEQGSPAAFVGVTRDVTEQKQMERELRASEEKFRRLTEQSFDGIFTQNRRGVFTYVSPAVRRIAGYEPEEVEGTFFGRYIRKRDLPKLLKAMVNLMRGHAVQGLRYSIRRKDGTLAMVEINATPIVKDGKSVGIQGNIRDITERAQAEERYRRLVESSPELIAEGDEEGRFVTANPAMARALGCSPEDIVGRHASEVLPDTVYRHRMACARKAMENDTIVEMEDEEGGRFYHNIFIPIDLPDGGRHVQLIARDITLRKKTEQALQESQEKYRDLYEFHQGILQHTPVGIITMDADMRIIYENRAMKEMMGVPRGKESRVMGMDIRETPAVQETGMAQQLDMVRQGKKIQGETSYTSVYGKKVYLSYVCSPIMEEDVFAGAVIIISDVTKRKEMNRELRESEAKFRSIFTNAPIGVALVDTDGRPVMSNPALREMLGYSEEELAAMPFPEFTHPDDVGKDLTLYRETKEGKRDSYSMEKRYICTDDTVVWANLTVSIVRDEDGEPLWAVGMVEDITERKHAEEERRRQMQLAALGRIAAVVSHELNTPLANIALAADCLASEHGLAGNEELGTIRRAVDNASSIVKQVLGFSRMDRMDVQPVDLASVVGEAVAAVRDTSPGDASVEVSVAPCRMLADEHHLYRAFVNVVKNAVLARESGGDGHHVSVASEASDGEVVVTIADNGVGMDPEVQAQADQPFFTTRPPGEGTGLGLYIARWIVERHGG
ncbi:MAG: PAS domain S-box protein, partial [Candidatus Thermoplasmatota archaeon]|nr:PAS domain S-box protein [Candidatus Thermoplasmatota archaeon]